jgi:hypothetical protein
VPIELENTYTQMSLCAVPHLLEPDLRQPMSVPSLPKRPIKPLPFSVASTVTMDMADCHHCRFNEDREKDINAPPYRAGVRQLGEGARASPSRHSLRVFMAPIPRLKGRMSSNSRSRKCHSVADRPS